MYAVAVLGQRRIERGRELHRPPDQEEPEEEPGSDAEHAVGLLALDEPGEEHERVEEADRAHADPDDERAGTSSSSWLAPCGSRNQESTSQRSGSPTP